MKNIIIIVTFLIVANISYSQTRNTLWLQGIGPSSASWLQTSNLLEIENYDFKDLHTVGNGGNYNPLLGVTGASDLLNSSITEENVLGIAHDYGGIILRDLQLQNNNISAMILDGVPNQGSSIIEYVSNFSNNGKTRAEQMIEDVLDFRSDSDCDEDCGYIENFQEFLKDMKANSSDLLDVAPNGAALQNLTDPTVPFIVIYGTVGENSILEMINTQSDQLGLGTDFYKTCYLENLIKAETDTKDAFIKATLNNTIGFASGFIGAIKTIIDTANPITSLLGQIEALFNGTKENVIAQITALAEKDEELARLAKCELSHQLLQAQWEIQLMQNSNLTYETEVVVQPGWSYAMCYDYCANDVGVEDNVGMAICTYECSLSHPNETVTEYTLLVEENDGILTKSEQLLDGSIQTYHLENTDHLEETSMVLSDLDQHLHEIFEGGAGAEFIIPKQ